MAHSRTDSKVNAVTGLFSEAQTNTSGTMTGNGAVNGTGLILTGSLKYAGANKFLF